MTFVSTRGGEKPVTFRDALFRGLAPDGGLYRPSSMPDLSDFFAALDEEVSFKDLAAGLTTALLTPEIDTASAERICRRAFGFSPAIVSPAEGIDVLELFHGPSCAFKDFGASFLAAAMEELLVGRGGRAIILTATSGDTGSAVAQAFHDRDNIDVVILYPSGRVSPLQEKQLTTLGGNITALEVTGSFDDCQKMAKTVFTDPNLANLPLSSANSINLGRLLPQSFYYVWAWSRKRRDDFLFCVPSGNFGNLTSGLYAAAWGLPVGKFIAATNVNDVVPEFLKSGVYRPRSSVTTYSNAMDVGSPSNFERMEALYGGDLDRFRDAVVGERVGDNETVETIARVERETGYLLCPHTAVGWRAAERYRAKNPEKSVVLLSTAHPGKFVEIVKDATGREPILPPALRRLMDRKKVAISMKNDAASLARWLRERFEG